jgi:hypothetical protein
VSNKGHPALYALLLAAVEGLEEEGGESVSFLRYVCVFLCLCVERMDEWMNKFMI